MTDPAGGQTASRGAPRLLQFDRSPVLRLCGGMIEKSVAGFLSWIRLRRTPTFRPVQATLAIAVLMAGIHIGLCAAGGEEAVSDAGYRWGIIASSVWDGEVWRLLTHGFVHVDWDHVRSNLKYIVPLGLVLEPMVGATALAVTFAVSTIVAGLAHMTFGTGCGAGSSAGMFGWFGLLLALPFFVGRDGRRRFNFAWPVALWLVKPEFELGPHPDANFSVHLGGLAGGLLCGGLLSWRRVGGAMWRPNPRRFALATAAAAGLVVAVFPYPALRMAWHYNAAAVAERWGASSWVQGHLSTITHEADPGDRSEARCLLEVASVRLDRGDTTGARPLLEQVAQVLRSPAVQTYVAALCLDTLPVDTAGAEKILREVLESNPTYPDALDLLAQTYLDSTSSRFSPARARALARNAVREDGANSPTFRWTLAWADFHCGDTAGAVRGMKRYIVMSDIDSTVLAADLRDLAVMEARLMAEEDAP